ncbi:hypothetical protein GGX14DRAFT_407685 [Mycena pura]|uniref:Uncharacterized protein n=1 Tax=Mycena pura TaxID=153505 RepID=A0AAD6UPC5_9AGAR|nr:hypothetical protein GGX14DRAFT_407685 [Mycena pura]
MSAPCTVIPTGNFQLSDFQGFCLTAVFATNTVVETECILPPQAPPDQTQWSFVPVNHGHVLLSGISQVTSETILLDEDANGKAITGSNTGFGFNISCFPFNTNLVTLVDNLVGTEITLTSPGIETAQVVFEPFTDSIAQLWNIEALD